MPASAPVETQHETQHDTRTVPGLVAWFASVSDTDLLMCAHYAQSLRYTAQARHRDNVMDRLDSASPLRPAITRAYRDCGIAQRLVQRRPNSGGSTQDMLRTTGALRVITHLAAITAVLTPTHDTGDLDAPFNTVHAFGADLARCTDRQRGALARLADTADPRTLPTLMAAVVASDLP